jgi:TatD DNase family protein
MKFVDAHVHLSDAEYSDCINEVIVDARKSSVFALVSNSMDLKTSVDTLQLCERFPGLVYAALGIHPWNVQTLKEDELAKTKILIEQHRGDKSLLAIGEIGLDIKYMQIWEKQMNVFIEMLHLAEKLNLPLIIHSRGTTAQIVDMLPSFSVKKVLLHWFSNPISALSKAIENGYLITEGVPTVYSNGIREVVKRVPLTNLLTETDGPVRFFTTPFDGSRTTPALVPTVVKAIAEIKGLAIDDVADQIARNFEAFFGVKLAD